MIAPETGLSHSNPKPCPESQQRAQLNDSYQPLLLYQPVAKDRATKKARLAITADTTD